MRRPSCESPRAVLVVLVVPAVCESPHDWIYQMPNLLVVLVVPAVCERESKTHVKG